MVLLLINTRDLFDPIADADEVIKYKYKGSEIKAYRQKSEIYESKYIGIDKLSHGLSKYKIFKSAKGNKSILIGDVDEYGQFIVNKHSSNIGQTFEY